MNSNMYERYLCMVWSVGWGDRHFVLKGHFCSGHGAWSVLLGDSIRKYHDRLAIHPKIYLRIVDAGRAKIIELLKSPVYTHWKSTVIHLSGIFRANSSIFGQLRSCHNCQTQI